MSPHATVGRCPEGKAARSAGNARPEARIIRLGNKQRSQRAGLRVLARRFAICQQVSEANWTRVLGSPEGLPW